THGALTPNPNGTYKYQPTPGWTGTDNFNILGNDSIADSNPGGLSITVTNAAPTFSNIANQTINEGDTLTLSFDVNDPAVTQAGIPMLVSWGEGRPAETTPLPATQPNGALTTFSVNTIPTATPQDDYTIGLSLDDGSGGVTNQNVVATVQNVAPTAVLGAGFW